MAIEDQVKALEDEFKLLKSEMRQTLVNVRDFLLDLKLPPIQEEIEVKADPPPAPTATQPEQFQSESPNEDTHHDRQEQEPMYDRQAGSAPGCSPASDGDRPSFLPSETEMPSSMPASAFEDQAPFGETDIQSVPNDIAEDSTPGDFPMDREPLMSRSDAEDKVKPKTDVGETGGVPSQINLLANLIRWVASAKKEIGIEQLPVFLDVYAMSGNLPQEMKAVILHLAEVATDPIDDGAPLGRIGLIREQLGLFMKLNVLNGQNPQQVEETIARLAESLVQQSTYANRANVWSQLLLELNGILGDGNVSLHLLSEAGLKDEAAAKAESDTEVNASEQPQDKEDEQIVATKSKAARLRLVLPTDSGDEQELDLGELLIAKETPKHNGNGHKKVSVSER